MHPYNMNSKCDCSSACIVTKPSPLPFSELLMLNALSSSRPASHYLKSCLTESFLSELTVTNKSPEQSSSSSSCQKPLTSAAKRRHRRKRNQMRRYAFLNATIHDIANNAVATAASILGSQNSLPHCQAADRKTTDPFLNPNSFHCNHSNNEHFYNCYNASSYKIKSRLSVKETHQLAEISADRNDKLKSALKISEDFVPGSSMDIIRQAKEQQAAREEKLRANKDLITATLKTEQNESPFEAQSRENLAKRSNKKAKSYSDSSSESSSSDSSDSSDSEDSSDSTSSSSDSSSSDSSYSERSSRKGHHSKEKRRGHAKGSRERKKSYKSKVSSREQDEKSRKRIRSEIPLDNKNSRNDSLPRVYSRYSTSIERSHQANSPPRRQLQSFVSSNHRQTPLYRSENNLLESDKAYKKTISPTNRRSNSPGADSGSRSNSPVPSRRRDRSYSRSVSPDRSYSRRSRNGNKSLRRDFSHSRSRSPSPRYRRDLTRRRSDSRDRYRRPKDTRRRSPSSSTSRSRSRDRRSKSFSTKSERSTRSRSRSIPRRRGSPSFLDKRRITRY